MHGPMDEVDRLAGKILDAVEDIPQLRLKRLMVPDERRRGSLLEMEVAATGTSFASRGIEVGAETVRDSATNEPRRFLAHALLERGGYGRAVAEARVIGEAATHCVPAPGEAQKNRRARPPTMEERANSNYAYFDGVRRGQGGRGRAGVAPRERLGRGRVGRPDLEGHALGGAQPDLREGTHGRPQEQGEVGRSRGGRTPRRRRGVPQIVRIVIVGPAFYVVGVEFLKKYL